MSKIKLYNVQDIEKRENAEAMQKKLKAAGFDSFIVKANI